jgi:hypothetical protein
MSGWRRYLQGHHRRILHCEHFMHHHRRGYVLGLHQAGGHEDPGIASESMAGGSWNVDDSAAHTRRRNIYYVDATLYDVFVSLQVSDLSLAIFHLIPNAHPTHSVQ